MVVVTLCLVFCELKIVFVEVDLMLNFVCFYRLTTPRSTRRVADFLATWLSFPSGRSSRDPPPKLVST